VNADGPLLDVRVARHWREALDIAGLELVSGDGAPLPPFAAGAFVDVLTPAGPRAYSLCNAPGERHRYLIAVQRGRGGAGSAWLHDRVRAGDRLQLRPPRNDFPLASHAVHSVLVAGGIGIAPLAAMAHALWQRGTPFELHYSCRSAARAAWRLDLQEAPFACSVHFHFSDAGGRLDLARLLRRAPPASELYVCGPSGLVQAVAAAQRQAQRDAARLHVESFG
jgi:vanillate O-demethylase ferredoxin subunit